MNKSSSFVISIHGLLAMLLLSGCAVGPSIPKLHTMIMEGDVEGTRKLIERRVDIDTLSETGHTPLHLAVSRNYPAIVEWLAAAGANLNTRTHLGETPLILACRKQDSGMAKLLAGRGAQINPAYKGTNALSEAIRYKHLDLVELFISRGANVEVRNHFGETPLFYAVHFESEGAVRLLVRGGANVNTVADDGRTALHVAALKQDRAAIDLLLQFGAEVRDADASEVALYSTARLYQLLGDSALNGNNKPQALIYLKKSAKYYSESARKFEQVASNHEASAQRVQSANTFSVAFAGLAAFGQAYTQAGTMAQVTPRGQTATGYGMAPYVVRSTAHLNSLAARYRTLADMSKTENSRLLSMVSCIDTRMDAVQTCRSASR
jgi:ankyrin repeat protein